MRYRQLPRTDIALSEICFGLMRFVPVGSGPDAWRAGFAAIDAAVSGGVNVIHFSEQYPTFAALSAYLGQRPGGVDLHHIVKVHAPDYEEERFDPSALRKEIERLLRALHTDHIAVVQHLQRGPNCRPEDAYDDNGDRIRIPAIDALRESLLDLSEELKQEGKIGSLMTFPHTMPYARAILDRIPVDRVVHFFNPLETEVLELFGELERREMDFIAIRPLLQGMITDRRVPRDRLPADDDKNGANWDPWYALLADVRRELGDAPESWTSFALRFALTPRVVSTVVASLNTSQQVEAALGASGRGPLPASVIADVDRVVGRGERIANKTLF